MLRLWVIILVAVLISAFIIGAVLKKACHKGMFTEGFDNRVNLEPGRFFWNYFISADDMYKIQEYPCNPWNGNYTQCTNNIMPKKISEWWYGYNVHH